MPTKLNLYALQATTDLDHQVVPLVLRYRLGDRQSEFGCGCGDLQLGDVPLVVRVVHEQMFPCDPDGMTRGGRGTG